MLILNPILDSCTDNTDCNDAPNYYCCRDFQCCDTDEYLECETNKQCADNIYLDLDYCCGDGSCCTYEDYTSMDFGHKHERNAFNLVVYSHV